MAYICVITCLILKFLSLMMLFKMLPLFWLIFLKYYPDIFCSHLNQALEIVLGVCVVWHVSDCCFVLFAGSPSSVGLPGYDPLIPPARTGTDALRTATSTVRTETESHTFDNLCLIFLFNKKVVTTPETSTSPSLKFPECIYLMSEVNSSKIMLKVKH